MIRRCKYLWMFIALVALPLAILAQEAPAPAPPAAKAKSKEEERPPITDPAVLAILESEPKTPVEQFRAVKLLAGLGEPKLAQPILKKLLEAKLDDATLAALAESFGTAEFLQFSKIKELDPEADQFATAVLAAASKVARDPARLEAFIAQLADPDQEKRAEAVIGLRRAGSAAIWPMFTALLDANRAAERPALQAMIVRMKEDAIEPLISILNSPDMPQRSLAIQLLGQLRAEQALPFLIAATVDPDATSEVKQAAEAAIQTITGAASTPKDVRRLLQRYATHDLQTAKLIESQDNYGAATPLREVWIWDTRRKQPIAINESRADTARRQAVSMSRALLATNLTEKSYQQLFLTSLLEDAKHRHGLDQPLPADVVSRAIVLGVDVVDSVLREALQAGNAAAAIGAAEILGKIGSTAILSRTDGRSSPLADAAKNADRRVRFAAIEAILNLKPTTSFAGASAVSDGLKYFASTTGFKRALIADPRAAVAQQLASYLSQLGYEVDIATNGRDAFRFATSSPDYEVAFIHSAIDRPRADDLVAQLRKDPRTIKLPIAIIAVPDHEAPANRLARGTPLSLVVAEPQDAAAIKQQAERLLGMPDCAPIPLDVRKRQAVWAITTLAQLAENPLPWIDARAISRSVENSLYAPGMTAPMLTLLGNAGTATGQTELVELAARETLPLPTRELASVAFARSVAKHGVLLTKDQILAQYDLYNGNAGRNPDTHKVLLTVIEAIEASTAENDDVKE
jgi:CheY-like chemotaxis protein/HEAT repeat protein